MRIIVCAVFLTVYGLQGNAQRIPEFKNGFKDQLEEKLKVAEGLYYDIPEYANKKPKQKRKIGNDCAKWLKENYTEAGKVPIIRNYMNFLLGAEGYGTISGKKMKRSICNAQKKFWAVDRNTGKGTDYLEYLAGEFNLSDKTFQEICNGRYLTNNSIDCINCGNEVVDGENENTVEEEDDEADSNEDRNVDSDGDGILDSIDECPDQKGLVQLSGCPDTDNDGVANHNDKCPEDVGELQYEGCPDSDSDGIPDFRDRCPNESGYLSHEGCPVVITTSQKNRPIFLNQKEATFTRANGEVLRSENLGVLFKELLMSGEFDTPFLAFDIELPGSINYNKFSNSNKLIVSLEFLEEHVQKRIQFGTGEYTFSQLEQPNLFDNFETSIDDLTAALKFLFVDLGVGVDILVQGAADKLEFSGTPQLVYEYDGRNYQSIEYYVYDKQVDVFQPFIQKLENKYFTNDELPNLRGYYLFEALAGYVKLPSAMKDRLILFEGVVTSRKSFKDRHASILLAFDWNEVELAALEYQKKLLNSQNQTNLSNEKNQRGNFYKR